MKLKWRHTFLIVILGICILFYFAWRLQERINPSSISIKRNIRNIQCAQCRSFKPCLYRDELSLRVMVLTFNRAESLKKCLASLQQADIMGVTAAMEIWIDVSEEGTVDQGVLKVANTFKWQHGRTCVHIQTNHSNSGFQWIYTWRPRQGSKEIGVFIEDDVDVSKYFFRFLKKARDFYSRNTEIVGICLYDVHCMISGGPNIGGQIIRPRNKSDIVFLYGLICTYGYAPFPDHWRAYQDWYHNNVSLIPNFDPSAKEIKLHSQWYKIFNNKNQGRTMLHSMYFMRYIIDHKLYTLHPNLQVLTPRPHSLATHRKEKGLHYSGKGANKRNYNLNVWREEFVNFPKSPTKFDWTGEILENFKDKRK